ncbi:hypothetical protein AXG93_3822s1350 [Marchantia polymorpha subsp. ruderalis]|uniref:Uncharacterized protein n=1 Tax=Marchantia polymorpha subsp. ruderalis TaxID=1480154 RepID=A0A176WJY6_MARPO|nr:hypothetical protein AXG93_3822s1350 [Marchantia polymorpha subsp. ruderalis]
MPEMYTRAANGRLPPPRDSFGTECPIWDGTRLDCARAEQLDWTIVSRFCVRAHGHGEGLVGVQRRRRARRVAPSFCAAAAAGKSLRTRLSDTRSAWILSLSGADFASSLQQHSAAREGRGDLRLGSCRYDLRRGNWDGFYAAAEEEARLRAS